jgi:hypothetical protein
LAKKTTKERYTILIQGPLNNNSLDNVESYKSFGRVCVSFWSDMVDPNWESLEVAEAYLDSLQVEYTSECMPNIQRIIGASKESTFYFALKSMFNGLRNINTDFVIKTRSDESYKNLKPFLEEFEKNENKIVCGNIFVRNEIPFHFGDHIFICKTSDLFGAVKHLLDMYDGIEPIQNYSKQEEGIPAERILCTAILNQKNVNFNLKSDREIFKDNISIIDINRTEEFIAKWQHTNTTYNENFINPYRIRVNDDY